MTNQLSPAALRATDRNGEPQSGALAWYYETGTLNAVTVTDRAGTPLPWPVVADIHGVFPQRFYAGALVLKEILTDADSVILPGYPVDPAIIVTGAETGAADISFNPTDQAPSLTVQGALEDLSNLAEAQGDLIDGLDVSIDGAGLATASGDAETGFTVTVPIATEDDATEGTSNAVAMTPLRTREEIDEFALTFSDASANQTITSAALVTWAHGLDRVPAMVSASLKCLTADAGWAVGDVIAANLNSFSAATNRANTLYADATNVYVRLSDAASCFIAGNKATGVVAALTNASWALVLRAW